MRDAFQIYDQQIQPGRKKGLKLQVSEFITAVPTYIPVTIIHGVRQGPTLFLTAAVHGDELNGIEIIRQLTQEVDPEQLSGTLLCVPVVNIFGFQNHSRYLPNGDDLNRFFPGSENGSMVERYTAVIFQEIVRRSDYGLDLHTASQGLWNLPHIRAETGYTEALRLAKAFGTRVILDFPGQEGSLRRSATMADIPTLVFEAGEIGRFEMQIAHRGLRGVYNMMFALGMLEGEIAQPDFQLVVQRSVWIRAGRGGLLSLSVKPGDMVKAKQEIAVNTNPFGRRIERIRAPFRGLVIGLATDPAVHPGQAVCHLVELDSSIIASEDKR